MQIEYRYVFNVDQYDQCQDFHHFGEGQARQPISQGLGIGAAARGCKPPIENSPPLEDKNALMHFIMPSTHSEK